MINELEVRDRMKMVLAREAMLEVKPQDMDDDAAFIEEYGMDSIQVLQFIIGLEEEFGISLEDDELDLEVLHSIRSVTEHIMAKIAGSAAPSQEPAGNGQNGADA